MRMPRHAYKAMWAGREWGLFFSTLAPLASTLLRSSKNGRAAGA